MSKDGGLNISSNKSEHVLASAHLGSDSSCGDVGGAVLVMVVVVVHMSTSPPVILFVVLFLALGAALHGMRVRVRVDQQRGGGGQLLEGSVRGFYPDCGFAQQVNGVGQSGQDELKTLLEETT